MSDSLRTVPEQFTLGFTPARWPLGRFIVLILAGTFLGLAADLRLEHVEAVHDNKLAWTPIIYSGLTAIVAALAGWRWSTLTRRIALCCFLLGAVIGPLGFYLHNRGNFPNIPGNILHAWTDPTLEHSHAPPQNAPMTFATLGLLGALACLGRFSRKGA